MIVTAIVYILLGFGSLAIAGYVLFMPGTLGNLDPMYKNIFGVMLVLYGIFRVVTGVQVLRNPTKFLAQRKGRGVRARMKERG